MPINIGYIELSEGPGIVARIYYDTTWLTAHPTDPGGAPLIDGPRSWCLDMTNTTGKNYTLVVNGVASQPVTVNVGQGDPVTTGPASGRSRTAADMATLGFTTRGSVGQITLG